jgi:DNA-binding transcriptional ArsR family regulator
MSDQKASPDYELDDVLILDNPAQFKAIGHRVRQTIFGLLLERAATTSQLAAALGLPKGTVGSHLTVLRDAGLIRVVRTRQVRALTEKYYGRVARHLELSRSDAGPPAAEIVMRRVVGESAPGEGEFLLVHSRVPPEDVPRFVERLQAVADEFSAKRKNGAPVYGLVAGIYLTTWPELPAEDPLHEHH